MKLITLTLGALLLTTASVFGFAQTEPKKDEVAEVAVIKQNMLCTTLDNVTDFLNNNNEQPMAEMIAMVSIEKDPNDWPGKEIASMMFVNTKTYSWTIVGQFASDVYCIIASGTIMTPTTQKLQQQKQKDQLDNNDFLPRNWVNTNS